MADKDKKETIKQFYDKLSKREKMVFYSAVFCVTLLIMDRMILLPIVNRLDMFREKIELRKSVIKDGLMIIGYREGILKEFSVLRGYLAETVGTQEEELAAFLKKLENLAVKSGVYIVSITPSGDIEEAKSFSKYNVELECRAGAKEIVHFMHSIGSAKELMKVETFELTPAAKDSSELKCSMRVSKVAMAQ